MLDHQAELVDGHFACRKLLAEGGDDGGGALLAGAVGQCHVRNPGRAGCAGNAEGPGDLEGGGWAASKIGARALAGDMGSRMPSGW